MIHSTMYADNLIDFADEIVEESRPMLLAAVDGALKMFQEDVQHRLSRTHGTFGPLMPGQERSDGADSGFGPLPSPRRITGELMASIKRTRARIKGNDVLGVVTTTHDGAGVLEYGGVVLTKAMKATLRVSQRGRTVASTRFMKKELKSVEGSHQRRARPFMRPAAEYMRKVIEESFS